MWSKVMDGALSTVPKLLNNTICAMKKFSLVFAATAVMFASCSKVNTTVQGSDTLSVFTLVATSEDNIITKAKYDEKGRFTWANGDCIGVHRVETNSSGTYTWNEEMLLASGDGEVEGTFKPKNQDNTANKKFGPVAFYPYTGQSGDNGTNLYNGILYFRLKENLTHSATSHPLPLAVQLPETDGDQTVSVKFSQIGAGVRVFLNNVPAKANKLSLTVAETNIVGEFPIALDKIGAADADCPNAENALRASNVQKDGGNTVSYTFDTASAARSMEFVFPLPTTDLPSLQFDLYIEGESIPVWSVTTPRQPALGRGDLLDMPKLALAEPYYIYLIDNDKFWKLHAYIGSDNLFGNWPGKSSTAVETLKVEGVDNTYYNCHRFSIPAKYYGSTVSLIFNDGYSGGSEHQTPSIDVTLGDTHNLYFWQSPWNETRTVTHL